MLSDEEKQSIEYLKARLYGNEGCKIIDVAQSDLRIFLKLVKNLQKDIKSWKKYCDEQENNITLKNNKICDLEFKIEKQSKEIEELNEKNIQVAYGGRRFNTEGIILKDYISKDKIKELFKKLNKIKSRTDGKVNAWDYMILGDTTRATGRFINLDYIEKILFDEDGYSIGE